MSGLVDNIRASLLGLKMPRALEMLDHTIQRLEKGELGAIEAIDGLLSEEFNCREGRECPIFCVRGFRSMLREKGSMDHGKDNRRRDFGRAPEGLRAACVSAGCNLPKSGV